jgi:iron complex outermembrane receptor protein
VPNPKLKPEKIRTAEVVWEQGLSRHLWLSTSVFYTRMHGLITAEALNGNYQIYRNLQETKSTGTEEEIRGQLSNGLEGSASYSFQHTKDADSDLALSNSPTHLVKLSLSQSLIRDQLSISVDGQYRSRIQSLLGQPISPSSVLNLTLLARKLGRHLDLSASVYNVLGKRNFDPPSNENLRLPIQQDGRGLRFTMAWHWGE